MGRKRTRRQPHGSAWYWKQTGCWYYTPCHFIAQSPWQDPENGV